MDTDKTRKLFKRLLVFHALVILVVFIRFGCDMYATNELVGILVIIGGLLQALALIIVSCIV